MLAIRMQRTGRKGHAQFRVIVQDTHRSPTSGKIVAGLGHYDPHTKVAVVNKEKATFYLEHGAQPSDRVAQLLTQEGVKLPGWVKPPTKKSKSIRHSDKLRKNRPAEPKAQEPAEQVDEADETPQEQVQEGPEVKEGEDRVAVVEATAEKTPEAEETETTDKEADASEEIPEKPKENKKES